MTITYPTTLDTLTNPLPSSDTSVISHSQQHSDANDAIEALEEKVGINGSSVNTTLDYKTSGIATGDKAASLTGTETLTNKKLSDSTTSFVDSVDSTKAVKVDVTGTTGITGILQTAFTTAKTIIFPDASDTLMGKETTDVMTNKTFDTAGAGNVLKIAGTQVSSVTGTGSAVLATNPTLAGATMSASLNEAKGADIASATTTDIGASTGNYVNVTGTTTITGLGTVQAGTRRIVQFSGALILTHNATSLILPSAANIGTTVGDTAEFISLGAGNWKCTRYTKADGTALVSASGLYSKGTSQINTSGTITHGLGVLPTKIKITAKYTVTNSWSTNQIIFADSVTLVSSGTPSSTDLSSVYFAELSGFSSLTGTVGSTAGRVLTNSQFPTITYCTISAISSTQFTLTWTFGIPGGGITDSISATKISILWECFA